jgi:hypothetical protein
MHPCILAGQLWAGSSDAALITVNLYLAMTFGTAIFARTAQTTLAAKAIMPT